MQPKYRTLLDQLSELQVTEDNKYRITEATADHAIAAMVNLFELIANNYDTDDAEALIGKALLSLRNRNSAKFQAKLQEIKEFHSSK